MTPEGKLAEYFVRRCKSLGLEQRKVEWSGHSYAPDRLVLGAGCACFIELKAPGEKPRPGQEREIQRLRGAGLTVYVCDNEADIDHVLCGLEGDRYQKAWRSRRD